ncbi:MAG TPA: hypothetical protein PK668_26305 [Myxococcota bacterium]|nr:hypothetical protein [Myxococcota bacterium]HRY97040.1 hypothetical protein [Myxococcota bacterium]HSA23247.1 hypothetical protein [Myxococcota bacterium]
MLGSVGWWWLAGLALEIGTAPAWSLGPVERCTSAVRAGPTVWLGCASGLWRTGPEGLAPVLPCAEEAPGSVRVRPLPPGPFEAVAATPCGLYFLRPTGPPVGAALPEPPSALDVDADGQAWVVADGLLWRCQAGSPCLVAAGLEELEDEDLRVLALRDGPRLWTGGRLLRPGPTWREEPAPGPGCQPLAGPEGELMWVDGDGRLFAPDASGRPVLRLQVPRARAERLSVAEGFPGGLWLADRRWFYVWRPDGWSRGPLPPGRGVAWPVAGEREDGLPWLLLGDALHRPGPARAPAPAWCPPAPAADLGGGRPSLEPGAGGARSWLPRLTLGVGGVAGHAAEGVGGVIARRAETSRWCLALGVAWPLGELAADEAAVERAALARERRQALAERLALAEELHAARDRLCRAWAGPAQRLELTALDEMLAVLRDGREAP